MTISVRMDPVLEQALTQAAKRLGVTKSQFIIDSVERALDRKNPFELMQRLQAEETQGVYRVDAAFQGEEQPYDSDASRQRLIDQLKSKHDAGSVG